MVEFKGIKTESLDPWIQENVIGNLLHPDTVEEGVSSLIEKINSIDKENDK